jgi:drug/metabolite transporter (DMT)-like permease
LNKATLGVLLALLFVMLESVQFVFFGGLFQHMSSFLFGFLVFGISAIVFISWIAWKDPAQIRNALSKPRTLIGVNVMAALAFGAYLMSVQLVEPAITYTISAGTMPITTWFLYKLGVAGENMRNRMESVGTVMLFFGIVYLAYVTISGQSGFVRGDQDVALAGVLLAVADGVFFTMVLVYSQRLSKNGVGAGAVLGLRLPLYVVIAGGCVVSDIDFKQSLETSDIALFVLLGLLLTIPPLYSLQKAISMISTLTISALTALGPFLIFALQLLEGRVDYSSATLTGLGIYFTGSLFAAVGAVKAATANTAAA